MLDLEYSYCFSRNETQDFAVSDNILRGCIRSHLPLCPTDGYCQMPGTYLTIMSQLWIICSFGDICQVSSDLKGSVLAEDIYAPQDVPPAPTTNMDGYAVRCMIAHLSRKIKTNHPS